jgi:hypothetical protein
MTNSTGNSRRSEKKGKESPWLGPHGGGMALQGDEDVLYLDCGSVYTIAYICQNSLN